MKKLAITTATVGAMTAVTMGLAGVAEAASTEGSSAADTVNSLRSQGYNVQLNGAATAPLSRCTVTGVSGLSGSMPAKELDTVYVDISCPPTNN
jgi:hypothetical protein